MARRQLPGTQCAYYVSITAPVSPPAESHLKTGQDKLKRDKGTPSYAFIVKKVESKKKNKKTPAPRDNHPQPEEVLKKVF